MKFLPSIITLTTSAMVSTVLVVESSLTPVLSHVPLSREEAVQIYNYCEKQRSNLNRAFCLYDLRRNIESDYYFSEDETEIMVSEWREYSNEELRKIGNLERKMIQGYLPHLITESEREAIIRKKRRRFSHSIRWIDD